MKAIIYFYSLTGKTKFVAEELSKQLNCLIEEIIDNKKRKGFFGFIKAGRDALFKKTTSISEIKHNPADFDLVIIGQPIWAGKSVPAISTLLETHKINAKTVLFFTSDGSNISDKLIDNVKSALQGDIISVKGFLKVLKNKEKVLNEIKSWATELKKI
jgi:flavodoxin